jgi:hypothetical protein
MLLLFLLYTLFVLCSAFSSNPEWAIQSLNITAIDYETPRRYLNIQMYLNTPTSDQGQKCEMVRYNATSDKEDKWWHCLELSLRVRNVKYEIPLSFDLDVVRTTGEG